MNEFNDWASAQGFDPETLTDKQRANLQSMWRASLNPVAGGGAAVATAATADPVTGRTTPHVPAAARPSVVGPDGNGKTQAEQEFEASVARSQAENQRKSDILRLCQTFVARYPDDVKVFQDYATFAIASGTSPKDAELELLRRSYHNGPMAFSPSKPAVDEKVLEAAVARAVGVSREAVEKDYGDKTLSAADKAFRGGCGLKRLVVTCARANGFRDADEGGFVTMNGTKALLSAAFYSGESDPWRGMASSGFGPSTYNLSGILSNVMNKSIRDYFMAVEQVWRMITATRPVNDFKEISGYALTGDLTYKEVAPGGEVKHGTLGETSYANQAKLFAIMLGIDYQHLRNDDLGAFNAINRAIGRGGALTLNKKFWTEFLATSPAFWSTANGNYRANTDVAFTLANLETVNLYWQLRTDPDGNPMGDRARFLLTPSKWELTARRYMRSTRVSDDSGSGEDNPVAGMWEPISSTYLSDATLTGSSADNYYLLADPANMAAIETVFLDGQEMPSIEMAEPDLSRLGIMVRGTHAFGVRRQEPRAGYKFKQTSD